MNHSKSFIRRVFLKIFIYLFLFGLLISAAFYFGIQFFIVDFPQWLGVSIDPAKGALISEHLKLTQTHVLLYLIPALAAVLLITVLCLWLGVRRTFHAQILKQVESPLKPKSKADLDSADAKAEQRKHDKKMFLYLVSSLQQDGRLLDFLSEDLSLYEDAQIGAAVRGIHENCKKVIDKNLSPKPIIDDREGDVVSVEKGFDPAAIKLTGNVSGEPPFTGILRHRGWKTKRDELPTLAGVQDAGILAPAEVEIQ